MRLIMILSLCLLLIAGGGWLFWNHHGDFKNAVSRYVESGEFQTLEARYLPQQIMDAHYQELVGDENHHYLEPTYKYHPYVLMEVKFTSDKKTREAVILWSLVNGEMVLNTDTWDQTHGFEDAINVQATTDEFKIINALAKSNGSRSKDDLVNDLQVDVNVLNPWIASALDKHLIASKDNLLLLHFENPKLHVLPQTKFSRMLVSKPYGSSQHVTEKYSPAQIEKITKAAFGSDFSIRQTKKVYLPIYGINVENPDGSTTTTDWNAVNGKMISPSYFKFSSL